MRDPDEDERLNPTDRKIISLLKGGRETRGSLADQIDRHPHYIDERLRWLREWGYVRYHHKETALHELDAEQ